MKPKAWSVYCMEDRWPGLWHIWEQRQIATVGWPPYKGPNPIWGFPRRADWSYVVNCLNKLAPGDRVVARLPSNRIGRVGTVVEKRVELADWEPVVPASKKLPAGEQGRHILVRWDYAVGPPMGSGLGCRIPADRGFQLPSWSLRRAIVPISESRYRTFERLLKDESTWTPISGNKFAYEEALSDYIATYPEQLEQGLRPYPLAKVRERITSGKDRLDVLLLDETDRPVVVECKQDPAALIHLEQLLAYMRAVRKVLGKKTRGILVFAGSPNVTAEVRRTARKANIALYCYRLDVSFTPCRIR